MLRGPIMDDFEDDFYDRTMEERAIRVLDLQSGTVFTAPDIPQPVTKQHPRPKPIKAQPVPVPKTRNSPSTTSTASVVSSALSNTESSGSSIAAPYGRLIVPGPNYSTDEEAYQTDDSEAFLAHRLEDEITKNTEEAAFQSARDAFDLTGCRPKPAPVRAQLDFERNEKGDVINREIVLDFNAKVDVRGHRLHEERCNAHLAGYKPRFKKHFRHIHHRDGIIHPHDVIHEGPHVDYNESIILRRGDGQPFPTTHEYVTDLDLADNVLNNCAEMNYKRLRVIQQHVIPLILESKTDAVVYARTGNGKTASYLIPLVSQVSERSFGKSRGQFRLPSVIIFAYNGALALQLCDRARKLAGTLPCAPIIAYAIGDGERNVQIEALKNKGCDMLIATIGRFQDMLRNGSALQLNDLKTVVFDEADRFERSELRMDYDEIRARSSSELRTYFFSSTYSVRTISSLPHYLERNYWEIQVGSLNSAEMLVSQTFVDCRGKNAFKEVWNMIWERKQGDFDARTGDVVYVLPKTMIFVNKKGECELLSTVLDCQMKLNQHRSNAVMHHADMPPSISEDCVSRFQSLANNRADVMVTTDRLAAGIDFPAVRLVINFDIPKCVSDYIQRIGRTGRNGHQGDSITIIHRTEYKSKHLSTLADMKRACADVGYPVPHFVHDIINTPRSSCS